jgi:cytochrome c556
MKKIAALTGIAALAVGMAAFAAEPTDQFADQVETRHGLMLQMAVDAGKLGAILKGETPYDAALATKAAQNIAAIASVISMDQFPAGSDVVAATDSFAKPELWANEADFLQKIADLNTATAAMVVAAGTSADAIKPAMAAMGAACSACHTAYRQPEN